MRRRRLAARTRSAGCPGCDQRVASLLTGIAYRPCGSERGEGGPRRKREISFHRASRQAPLSGCGSPPARRSAQGAAFAQVPEVAAPRRRLLPGRRAGRFAAARYGGHRGRRAESRAAPPFRQQSLQRVRPGIRAVQGARAFPAARPGQLVRPQVPRPAHLERRALRHVRHDRGASDAADPELRARHQRRQRARASSCASTTAALSTRGASSTCPTPPPGSSATSPRAARWSKSRPSCPMKCR